VAVLSTVLFEGLCFATTRFYSEQTRSITPAVRATLGAGCSLLALVLLAVAGLILIFDVTIGSLSSWSLAAIAGAVVGQSLFEYHGALARSRFQRKTYLWLVIVKNIAAGCLVIGGAFYFQSTTSVLLGLAISAMTGVAAVRRSLSDPTAHVRLASSKLARDFVVYAMPLIASNAIYLVTAFMNRSWLVSYYGFVEAGYYSLAWDVGLRIVVVAGTALQILLFQQAVRAAERDGQPEGERQLTNNASLIVVLLLPLVVGFWIGLPAIEALIVPAVYHGAFAHYVTIMLPAFLAVVLVQYIFTPVFQLRKRTAPVLSAALVCLGVNAGALFILPHWYGPTGVALAQLAGMIAAVGMLGALTLLGREAISFSGRDVGLSLLATVVMAVSIWPLRNADSPLMALALTTIVGGTIYGTFVWFMDLGSLRTLIGQRWALPQKQVQF
jgi:O-antigen/teichoic acid export membrane protein